LVSNTPGGAAVVNSGGGGGGSSWTSGSRLGGSGGSGIVIISYPSSYAFASATTGSPTVTVTGGNIVYSFTSSGSITFAAT
jgi:hypothetical protein